MWNTATEFYFECFYKKDVKLVVTDKLMVSGQKKIGVKFEGAEGWIYLTRGAYQTEPKSLWESQIKPDEIHLYKSENHYRNFIDCVVSRKEPITPGEVAHRSISIAQLGNIAMLLGRDLKWDPDKEQILNDPVAQWMLDRPYRAPWKLPVI